jgi:hypothetical protein
MRCLARTSPVSQAVDKFSTNWFNSWTDVADPPKLFVDLDPVHLLNWIRETQRELALLREKMLARGPTATSENS